MFFKVILKFGVFCLFKDLRCQYSRGSKISSFCRTDLKKIGSTLAGRFFNGWGHFLLKTGGQVISGPDFFVIFVCFLKKKLFVPTIRYFRPLECWHRSSLNKRDTPNFKITFQKHDQLSIFNTLNKLSSKRLPKLKDQATNLHIIREAKFKSGLSLDF